MILKIENGEYETQETVKYQKRKKYTPIYNGEIRAIMPGKVRQILVKQGDSIKKGTPLIVIEAMKMNNIIKSNYEGIVKEIRCNENEFIEKDSIIAKIE